MNLGEEIKRARKAKGLSQQDLANLIGVSLRTLIRYEQGVTTPSKESIKKISEYLTISINHMGSETRFFETITTDGMNLGMLHLTNEQVLSCPICTDFELSNGWLGFNNTPHKEICYVTFPKAFWESQKNNDPEAIFAIPVCNSSMNNAGIPEGSIAIVQTDCSILEGDPALLYFKNKLIIRWIINLENEGIELRCPIPGIEPLVLPSQVVKDKNQFCLIGKIICVVQMDKPKSMF